MYIYICIIYMYILFTYRVGRRAAGERLGQLCASILLAAATDRRDRRWSFVVSQACHKRDLAVGRIHPLLLLRAALLQLL